MNFLEKNCLTVNFKNNLFKIHNHEINMNLQGTNMKIMGSKTKNDSVIQNNNSSGFYKKRGILCAKDFHSFTSCHSHVCVEEGPNNIII